MKIKMALPIFGELPKNTVNVKFMLIKLRDPDL